MTMTNAWNMLALMRFIFITIFFTFFVSIVDAYSYSYFDQVNEEIPLLTDTVMKRIGENIDKFVEEIKTELATVPFSNQNNTTIFSENFEGQVKIIENRIVPAIKDPQLKIETVTTSLDFPTSMAFLAPDDILVLEKNKGTIRRIMNGTLLPHHILDVNVSALGDRGMLGIAVPQKLDSNNNIFVYFTENLSQNNTSSVEKISNKKDTNSTREHVSNRLYRYKLMNDRLVSPKLLIDIPAEIYGQENFGIHNGGKIRIGPDNNVYLIVGDIGGFATETQNVPNIIPLNATSVILRVSQDGTSIGEILDSKVPISKFYAYGIRNSFGMDFDPVTGKLWDTENGPDHGDEINLVEPGFNSGWSKIMGLTPVETDLDLVRYGGKGKYSNPEFMWEVPVAPTALKFFDSSKFGEVYRNDMFVGDFNNGTLYHFDLDDNRTNLDLEGQLEDRIANSSAELGDVTFGTGFGSITDIEVGPDGYLYVVSLRSEKGTPYPFNENAIGSIFRIRPSE